MPTTEEWFSCTRKSGAYARKSTAQKAIRRMIREGNRCAKTLEPYPCPHCGLWHAGHPRRRKKTSMEGVKRIRIDYRGISADGGVEARVPEDTVTGEKIVVYAEGDGSEMDAVVHTLLPTGDAKKTRAWIIADLHSIRSVEGWSNPAGASAAASAGAATPASGRRDSAGTSSWNPPTNSDSLECSPGAKHGV